VLAGFCGGVGRGLVEGPVEYIKVRRQVREVQGRVPPAAPCSSACM
jgi:hypothetical protein